MSAPTVTEVHIHVDAEILKALRFWEDYNRKAGAVNKAEDEPYLHLLAKADCYKLIREALCTDGGGLMVSMAKGKGMK